MRSWRFERSGRAKLSNPPWTSIPALTCWKESREALTAIASNGAWRLALTDDPSAAIDGCKPAGALMRVIHANFIRPPHHADPDRLLQEWPTLLDVAAAVAEAGIEISILQSFARDAVIDRRGISVASWRAPQFPEHGGAGALAAGPPGEGRAPDVIHVNGLDFAGAHKSDDRHGKPSAGAGPWKPCRARTIQAPARGLSRIAAAVFTDSAQARPFLDEGSISPRVRIFSVPESSTHFGPGDQDEARKATSTFGDPLVLWVGRLDCNKDPLTMLGAIELAASDLPGIQLWCCFHEQPMLELVKARIARSPALKEHVHLLGRVPHQTIELLFRAADIFIASSHHEAAGYALIEALACGAAPVVSDIPSFRRLRGDVGALASVGDAESFAAALKRIADQSRAELRRDVLDHFSTNLSFAAVGRQLREAYEASDRAMKIALVVPGGVDRSGTRRVIPIILWLIERLVRAGDEVHVFALNQEAEPGEWQLLGATVHNAGRRPRRYRSLSMILHEHRRRRFDIVHAFWAGAPGQVACAFQLISWRPFVVTLPGGDLTAIREIGYGALLRRRSRIATHFVLSSASAIVAPSEWLAKEARAQGWEPILCPFGVALDRWPPSEPRPRRPGAPLRLIHVASLNRVKDPFTLLDAMRLLADEGVDFTLDMIGEDTLEGAVQRHCATLSLDEPGEHSGLS